MSNITSYTTNDERRLIFTPYVLNGFITNDLEEKGYSHTHSLLSKEDISSSEWQIFKESWYRLSRDEFIKEEGICRSRRYSVFSWDKNQNRLFLEPHQPHYQTLDYNSQDGGIHRDFDPIESHIINHPYLLKFLAINTSICNELYGDGHWHIEVHQFRIECSNESKGTQIPQSIHRDGRDFAFIMFIDQENVAGGETTLCTLHKLSIDKLTMKHPSEAIFLDDHLIYHTISDISPVNKEKPCYRDHLIITFKEKLSNATS